MYLLKYCLPTNSQQTVVMSNNEDMEVITDRGHGLRGTNKNSEGHAAKGKKRGYRAVKENDREHLQQEQDKKIPPQQTQK
jgi:hypothetical protein